MWDTAVRELRGKRLEDAGACFQGTRSELLGVDSNALQLLSAIFTRDFVCGLGG